MRTCEWCRQAFDARRRQRFCSKRCAGLWRWRDQPRATRTWTAASKRPVPTEHRRLREQMLPAAIGTLCPLRISPRCTGVMLDPALMQLDHIVERANGGPTTRQNCRMVCAACNQRRGAQLGGRKAQARRSPPVTRRLPRW